MAKDNVLSAAGIGDRNIRLDDEFERTMRLCSWLRGTLEGEFNAALGTREQKGTDAATVKKLTDVVRCLKDLADTKIRLEKHAKDPARPMTPEREEAIARQAIRSWDPARRRAFLDAENEFHRESTL